MIHINDWRLTLSRDIALPIGTVWELLIDTNYWPRWGPSVTAVDCLDRRIGAAGSRGRARAPAGLWLPFVITSFSEMQSWDWRIGPIAATGHLIIALGNGRCRLSFEMPWWAVWCLPVCWCALKRIEKLAVATPS